MKSILLVEDDINIRKEIHDLLVDENFKVTLDSSIKGAELKLKISSFDIVLLDWRLTDGQGIEILKEMRRKNDWTPVIMITARSEVIDRVLGLELGANDYITKPFSLRELLARINVQLRQTGSIGSDAPVNELKTSDRRLILDKESLEVYWDKKTISFTKKERELLILLLENKNKVFTRDELLDQIWGYDHFPVTRTVDNHIAQLRQKLCNDLIETVRGAGYRLVDKER